jgi:GH15 family glucan-1,4-alpha-glucosidase
MALDRAVRLAEQGHINATHCARWRRERDRIRDWIDTHCWSETKQAYTQYAGSEKLDASLLLATRFEFERKDRLDLTRRAIQKELCLGPLVYRYSGMDKQEGTFLACSFWLVEAFAFLGHLDEARDTMDQLLALADKSNGVLSEMMDPETGSLLGNFPQGLSHLALIHAASAINDAHH